MPKLPAQSKADRLALAQFGEADIAQVAAFAASLRSPGMALDGKKIVKISAEAARQFWFAGTKASRFDYNRATLEYLSNSTPVDRAVVKAAADAASKEARFRIMDAALRLQQGTLDVAGWATEHNNAVKLLTGAESALARGGLNEMTVADWQSAAQKAFNEFGYGRAFAEDAARGRYGVPGDSMGNAVLQRAGYFANTGRATYENTQVENAKDRLGHDKARRIKGEADSCPDCIDWELLGWIDIDEMLSDYPIGASVCRDCHCIIITGNEGNLVD
jgi:hypothetical protein